MGSFSGRGTPEAKSVVPPTYERLPGGSAFELRCDLRYTTTWRTFVVPSSATLLDLHVTLQRAFDWDDSHLHEFVIGRNRYTPSDSWGFGSDENEGIDEASVRLDELVRTGATIDYTYDFGDDWRVTIAVTTQLEPDPSRDKVYLVDGAGDPPPDDCGGVGGFENLVAVLRDPNHPDHDDLSDWAGDFRPDSFDVKTLAARLRLR